MQCIAVAIMEVNYGLKYQLGNNHLGTVHFHDAWREKIFPIYQIVLTANPTDSAKVNILYVFFYLPIKYVALMIAACAIQDIFLAFFKLVSVHTEDCIYIYTKIEINRFLRQNTVNFSFACHLLMITFSTLLRCLLKKEGLLTCMDPLDIQKIRTYSGWCFQPIKKVWVKLDHFPKTKHENIANLSNHHPVLVL